MNTRVITNPAEFALLRTEWNDLAERSAMDHVFLSHDWLFTWWEIYGHGQPYVITCRDDATGELTGLLPLLRYRTGVLPKVTSIRFMGSERVNGDFLGCLAVPDRQEEVYAACLGTLARNRHHWDTVYLSDMDEAASFCRFLVGSRLPRTVIDRDPGKCCPYLALPDSWEVLLLGLSPKVRQRVGYYRRVLERKGEVELEMVSDPNALADALADLVRLRQDRLEQKGLSTESVTAAYRRFHALIMERFLESGCLRLWFLRLNGERIAFLYLFASRSRYFFYQTGFDRSWSTQSVGFVLLGRVIERVVESGGTVFEFLRGREKYKYAWGVHERQLLNLTMYNATVSGTLLRIKTVALDGAKREARNLLPGRVIGPLKKVIGCE